VLPPHSTLRLWCTAGIVAFLCLWACSVHAATDAAAPVLVSLLESSPSVLSPPFGAQVTPVGSYTVGAATARVSAVTFTSHSHHGQPVRIFGYLAMPPHKPGQKVAGLLILHGGGGRATVERAARGAASGFASLAIDLPGRGTGRWASRSTGPDMTVWNLFRTRPSLADNYLYHAVLAALRSVEFLRRQPEVDPERVGVYGMSWGGATALIAGSLDSRLAGVVDLFGSGYLRGECAWDGHLDKLDPAAVAAWQANFDPSAYVPRMKPPVLLVTGCNDGCYYLPRFLRTYETQQRPPSAQAEPRPPHRRARRRDGLGVAAQRRPRRQARERPAEPQGRARRV
jgi:dienelactone hydrolase